MRMLAQESSGGSFTPWIVSIVLYALVIGAWIVWGWKQAGKRESLGAYARSWLLGHPIRLVVLLVLGFFAPVVLGFGALLLIPALIAYALYRGTIGQARERAQQLERFRRDPGAFLARWGTSFEQRDAAIRGEFDQPSGVLDHVVAFEFDDESSQGAKGKSVIGFRLTRAIGAMEARYREALRAVELLNNGADGSLPGYLWMRLGLLWGDGKGTVEDFVYWLYDAGPRGVKNGPSLVQYYMGSQSLTAEAAINKLLETLGMPPVNERFARIQAEMRGVFAGGGSGGGASGPAWLSPGEVGGTLFRRRSDYSLLLGRFEDGTPLEFSGDESLITIAPPGSGKTQCDVFPNLLRWKGPAVVLDVSGDLYANTSLWRSRNVGPVYKFAPLDPGGTHRYSPLAFVRNEPDFIWEDSRLLADLMIVPSKATDPFWENEARNIVTAAIACAAYYRAPTDRPLSAVLDVLYGGQAWTDMLNALRMAVDVRVMSQNATALSSMNEKTLDSVRQTARSSLAAWGGERIGRATGAADWNPLDLRGGKNPTIYIVMQPNEVDSYLSVLRVFIGQHIRMLTGGAVPARDAAPILFMLDEMPRLRHMPPIDEALNIGRKYGLRLWMFAQSLGQIEEAYPNAKGLVGACGVRTFMNASLQDGTAESLAEQIGYRQGPMDSQRVRVVEPTVLAGPAFADFQVVLGTGAKPARVRKAYAWQDEALRSSMGALEIGAVVA
ncbi:MAG: type IV secretory system conjugative DNA transfer family protein [Phycisphaeraceae bacterium]|nr:type IV secretory system conjugative DNA transfer family protein [Phycisphaeraceae bacterium]